MSLHINAQNDDFAKTVFLTGDPIRAKNIAKNFTNYRLVSSVRGMLGFTGFLMGKNVSVMGSGMGMPSISIYAQELIESYGVEKIIRIGTCASVNPNVNLFDLVVPIGASTDSNLNRQRFLNFDFSATSDLDLTNLIINSIKTNVSKLEFEKNKIHYGNIFSTDLFYNENIVLTQKLKELNFLGVEMESAALFYLAQKFKIKASSILLVSDNLIDNTHISQEQKDKGFDNLIKVLHLLI